MLENWVSSRARGWPLTSVRMDGQLAESGNERLPLGCVGVGHRASVPSMAGVLSMSVIPSGLGHICHAGLMQFRCISSAIRFGVMQAQCR